MKKISLIVTVLFSITGSAQKPVLDTSAFNKWPSVDAPGISNSGTFVYYTIKDQPPV